jgi:prepilin-type N-terminal cleavage/methylation domain-containing protein
MILPRSHQGQLCEHGFTIVELLVTLTVIATLSVLIIPTFQDDAQLRVMAAASLLASDIEYAQVLSVSQPDDPVVVQFDTANATYWLAYADAPEEPLIRPDTGDPYLVEFGAGRGEPALDVSIWLIDLPDDRLSFDSNGGLVDFNTEPRIILGQGEHYRTLSIAATTGSLTETEGTPDGWGEE